jgi:hypothetical protein
MKHQDKIELITKIVISKANLIKVVSIQVLEIKKLNEFKNLDLSQIHFYLFITYLKRWRV